MSAGDVAYFGLDRGFGLPIVRACCKRSNAEAKTESDSGSEESELRSAHAPSNQGRVAVPRLPAAT